MSKMSRFFVFFPLVTIIEKLAEYEHTATDFYAEGDK